MFNEQHWTKVPCFGLSSSPNVSGLAPHQWTYKYVRIVARFELIESFRFLDEYDNEDEISSILKFR